MSVIIIGDSSWEEISLLADAVRDQGETPIIWDTQDWPSDIPIAYDINSKYTHVYESIDPSDVTGIYALYQTVFRPIASVFYGEPDTDTGNIMSLLDKYREWRWFFLSTMFSFGNQGSTVIPEPYGYKWHDIKPLMLDTLHQNGVPIPETIFTNEPERAKEFIQKHEKVVSHSVNGGIEPQIITTNDIQEHDFKKLHASPVKFQEFAPGDDVRCYVLDETVIGAVKYNYPQNTFSFKKCDPSSVTVTGRSLSPTVKEAAKEAIRVSPSPFGAVDIRITEDGEFEVLEVNITGRFAAGDEAGVTNVSGALAKYLTQE